jgi:glycosyltransferase involved in cell wall biosynthesis
VNVRLLVITDLYPPIAFGGYERTCADLVDGLQERHGVTVLTSNLRRDAAPPLPWVRRELPYLGPERLELLRVPKAAAQAARITRRVLSQLRPDLVYVSNCLTVPQAAPWTVAESGVPIVYRLSELWFASALYRGDRFVGHLFPRQRGARRAWSWLVRAVNLHPALRLDPTRPAPAAVSWCSDELRARVTLPPTIKPVLERTIHSGTSTDFATLTRRPAAEPTIAYVGRVTTAKGAELAVRALEVLRSEHGIAARLVMAGTCRPAMARRLERLGAERRVAHSVQLVGALERGALGRLLERAHAVVVPTVTHEAFGRVCVEAALARVPVVAARVGGIPEALHDGRHALLFPPGDVRACADALAATLQDSVGTEVRVRRAFEHAQQFSVRRFVESSEAFLQESAELLGRS